MTNKNLLNISEISKSDILEIIDFADKLTLSPEKILENKNIGLIFEKNSTRTRLSFKSGINLLKGDYIDIKYDELNLNRFESYEDTFEIISCYLDCLVFRTNDHQKLDLAKKYFNKPIINALSDHSHPCQAISDIYTIKEHFGKIDNLKIIWLGDMNNVLLSFVEICNKLGNFEIDIFTDQKIFKQKNKLFELNDNIRVHFEIDKEIFNSSDCIMTDVFNSMNDKNDKENVLKKFQVNQELMSYTKKHTIFMHCLPAKIGSEVTDDVIRGNQSIVLKQAKNRMISQMGILKWLDI